MSSATERVRHEVAALWMEVFGSPPAEEADPSLMLDEIIRRMAPCDYHRLSAADSARNLTFPRPEHTRPQRESTPRER